MKKTAAPMSKEGTIERLADGSVVVKVTGATHLAGRPGVLCLNPEDPEAERIYSKSFTTKPIYLPHEYDRAFNECLRGNDVVVLGMNGYSELNAAQCAAWGVKPGAYEAACAGILENVVAELAAVYPGVDVRIAHGASLLGVDKVAIEVATRGNLKQLGHSCPKFMFYVEDDDIPVYVAASQVEYANAFVDSLHILIAANGREQAFRHDIDAVFTKLKELIPINVLRAISSNGGPPPIGPDGKIEDAVATFLQRVHLASHMVFSGGDPYADVVAHVAQVTCNIARKLISPGRAFGRVQLKRH